MADDPRFTVDWMRDIPEWEKHLARFVGQTIQALEIGSYEGRSACWLIENILTDPFSELTCVDSYHYAATDSGSFREAEALNRQLDLTAAKQRFLENVKPFGDRVRFVRRHSRNFLCEANKSHERFSIIYLDAGHSSFGSLTDLVLSWPLLAYDGVLLVDDMKPHGHTEYGVSRHGPPMAMKSFLACQPDVNILHMGEVAILTRKHEGEML